MINNVNREKKGQIYYICPIEYLIGKNSKSILKTLTFHNFVAEFKGFYHHARNMERSFEEISFGWLRNSTITMQVAIPFTKLAVREMFVSPIAD